MVVGVVRASLVVASVPELTLFSLFLFFSVCLMTLQSCMEINRHKHKNTLFSGKLTSVTNCQSVSLISNHRSFLGLFAQPVLPTLRLRIVSCELGTRLNFHCVGVKVLRHCCIHWLAVPFIVIYSFIHSLAMLMCCCCWSFSAKAGVLDWLIYHHHFVCVSAHSTQLTVFLVRLYFASPCLVFLKDSQFWPLR